jgi:LPXTG-motif cell wall-anchored protein
VNTDNLLQPGETWIYTATANLTATTTNTATVTAQERQATVTDTASVTVTVTRTTVTGGELPNTGTPWYNVLLVGAALVLIGAAGWWRTSTTRKIHE